jgi:hypothetical protein
MYNDIIVQWYKMAGSLAVESVFLSRILIDLYRTYNLTEEVQRAEAYLE